ncbi:hypothetical protein D3C72_2458380 [compost metagenome]
MLQEANTQTSAVSGTFDQPWDIGNHEALLVVHTYHTQAWYQSGKRIVSHFRLGSRHCADKGRLAGVRQA